MSGPLPAGAADELRAARSASEPALRQSLRAPVWKAFSFEDGHFLLHTPSAHVLEVDEHIVRHVRGEISDPETASGLAELAAGLPLPPPRAAQTDIQALSLNMAQGCNLRCTYCFAGEGDYGVKAMMSFKTARRVLESFSAGKKNFSVIFFGGEPLLNFQVIKEIVEWAATQPCKFYFSMTTNGTLLTTEKLAWLRENKVALTLSYDGKGLQGKQRLNKDGVTGSEALVERKLEKFSKELHELRSVTIRTTVTREHLDELYHSVLTTITSQNFRLAVSHHATPLRALQFGDQDIEKLAAVYEKVIDTLLAGKDWDRLMRLDNIAKHVNTIHHGRTNLMACGAGVQYLTVSAEGGYYLCHRFNEDESERYGDVETGLDRARLAEIASFRNTDHAPCNACWMRQWCAGGCFHEHKAASGNKFRLDPMYCKLQDLEIKQAMRVYAALLKHAPHLLKD